MPHPLGHLADMGYEDGARPSFTPKPGCVGATICTWTGRYFDFLDPRPEQVDAEDIAHALSLLCRYTGHTAVFYSIAQHCVLASYAVAPEHAFAALMHDAHEAYVGDMSSPLKQLCPDYKAVEDRAEAVVAARFGLTTPWPAAVKRADLVLLMTEKRDLTPARDHHWPLLDGIEPLPEVILPWTARDARATWMNRFRELCPAHLAA